MTTIRIVAAGQCLAGALFAARPHTATALVGVRSPGTPPAWIVRMLGIRMLVQGGVELARPRHDVIRVGAAVDATHALSMVGVALVSPRYRRGAVISAAIATASAAALSLTEAAAR